MQAAQSGEKGQEIVPKVHLHATHERALDVVDLGVLKKFAAEPEVCVLFMVVIGRSEVRKRKGLSWTSIESEEEEGQGWYCRSYNEAGGRNWVFYVNYANNSAGRKRKHSPTKQTRRFGRCDHREY